MGNHGSHDRLRRRLHQQPRHTLSAGRRREPGQAARGLRWLLGRVRGARQDEGRSRGQAVSALEPYWTRDGDDPGRVEDKEEPMNETDQYGPPQTNGVNVSPTIGKLAEALAK